MVGPYWMTMRIGSLTVYRMSWEVSAQELMFNALPCGFRSIFLIRWFWWLVSVIHAGINECCDGCILCELGWGKALSLIVLADNPAVVRPHVQWWLIIRRLRTHVPVWVFLPKAFLKLSRHETIKILVMIHVPIAEPLVQQPNIAAVRAACQDIPCELPRAVGRRNDPLESGTVRGPMQQQGRVEPAFKVTINKRKDSI